MRCLAVTALLTVAVVVPTLLPAQEWRVAVSPLVHGELPAESDFVLGQRVAAHITANNEATAVMTPAEFVMTLDSLGLVEYWDRFLFVFLTTGIVDRIGLEGLCDALAVDAILHTEVSALIEQGPWVLQRRYVLRGLRAILRAWLFDCAAGAVRWERSGEGQIEDIQDSRTAGFDLGSLAALEPTGKALHDLLGHLPRIAAPEGR